MAVARSLSVLKGRVDEYLWREESPPIRQLRAILDGHFLLFPKVAIVGGLARDLARKGKVGFKSDIDLVIDAAAEDVTRLAEKLSATPNRFGGYASYHHGWKIDFWALENTWAVTHRHVSVGSIEEIIRTTFFDCDAICYILQTRKIVATDDYLARLRARTIDINLRSNPSMDGNLLRAIRRILTWGFKPGPMLRQFIEDHLDDTIMPVLAKTEKRLYPIGVITRFENAAELKALLFSRRPAILFTTASEQLQLPGLMDD